MSYTLNFSSSVALSGQVVFGNLEINPNSLIGAEFEFDQTESTEEQPMDFTFAAVNQTAGSEAGVQAIIIKSDVDATVDFKTSADADLLTATLLPGTTLIGARSDANVSIPFNFTIPTSGTVAKVEVTKENTSGGGVVGQFRSGKVTIWVYYNRANT